MLTLLLTINLANFAIAGAIKQTAAQHEAENIKLREDQHLKIRDLQIEFIKDNTARRIKFERELDALDKKKLQDPKGKDKIQASIDAKRKAYDDAERKNSANFYEHVLPGKWNDFNSLAKKRNDEFYKK